MRRRICSFTTEITDLQEESIMTNANNFGTLHGRLARDFKEFKNADGSSTLLGSIAVDRDYTNAKGEVVTDYPNISVYVPASVQGLGPWGNVHEGDLIGVLYTLQRAKYTNAQGQVVYPDNTVAVEGFPRYHEPKAVTEKRKADKDAKRAAAANQAQAPTAQAPAQTQAQNPAPAAPAANQGQEDEIARLERELAEAQAGQAQAPTAQAPATSNGVYSADQPFS